MGEDLKHIVQKFCPVFVFHPEEKYFCCKPEWFVKQCKLVKVVSDDHEQTVRTVEDTTYEEVDRLTRNASFGHGYRLMIENKERRTGQVGTKLCHIPLFAKLKKMKLPSGDWVLEINYIAFMAYSGPYRVLAKMLGDHDGDWEHITVRCTPDGKLIAVYYSSHRHSDGTWVPAKDCRVDVATGRLLAFVSLNGHGMYPKVGVQPRIFFMANDKTSSRGRVWGSKECVILAHPGTWLTKGNVELKKVPEVEDRGVEYTQAFEGSLKNYKDRLEPRIDDPAPVHEVEVTVPGTDWMHWRTRWGEVVPPWTQQWFKSAEHPQGSNPLKRTFQPWRR